MYGLGLHHRGLDVSSEDIEDPGQPPRRDARSEIDALIAAFESNKPADPPPPATLDPIPQAPSRPVPVASLMLNAHTSSDMDALIRQASGVAAVPPGVSESDVEAALDQLAAAAGAPVESDFEPAPDEDDSDLPLARVESGLDDLIDGPSAELAESEADEPVIDERTESHTEISRDVVPAVMTDDFSIPETAEPSEMDEVLALVEENQAPAAPIPTPTVAAATPPPPDSVTQTTVFQEVGSENVAAGAAVQPLAPERPKPARSDGAQPAPAAAPDPSPPRRVWLPPSFLVLARQDPMRSFAAAAAGLLVTISTFALLYSNRLRPAPTGAVESASPVPLASALRTAEALVEDKDYAGAVKLLDSVLLHAAGDSPELVEAKFLRAQAMVLAAPGSMSDERGAPVLEAIDDAIDAGHGHPKTPQALMWKSVVYEKQGNMPAARAELRGVLDDFPQAPERDDALLALAELELRTGRRQEAMDAAEKLLNDSPGSPLSGRARVVQGDALALGSNTKAARAAYLLAAAERSGNEEAGIEAYERLGQLALKTGEPEAAIEVLLKRLDTATTVKGNDVIYLALARAYRAAKQPEKARNVLNELVDFFPDSPAMPAALVELSRVLEDLGLPAEAARLADRAADRYPKDADVLRRVGETLEARGFHGDAGLRFREAYDAGAHDPALLLSAGQLLLEGGEPEEAQTVFDRIVNAHAASPEALEAKLGWARAAYARGRLEDAFTRLQDLGRVTEGGPRQMAVLRVMIDLYRELGLEGELIETYGKIAALTAEPGPLAEAAQGLFEAGADDEGLQVAPRVDLARLDATRAYPFLIAWGKTLLRKDSEEALRVLTYAHEQFPEQRSSEGVETIIRASITLGRSAQARALVDDLRARASQPGHESERGSFEQAAVHYADFLFDRGDYSGALDAYAMLLPSSPGVEPTDGGTTAEPMIQSPSQRWSAYQRANALYAMGDLESSLGAYTAIASGESPYANDAKARLELIRFELRKRGQTPPETPDARTAS